MYVMEISLRPRLKQSESEYKLLHKRSMTADEKLVSQGEDRRDKKILGKMWVMIAFGLTSFLGGFFIWSLDNVYCSKLRVWRREIGLPWGILLEGHGWWYVPGSTSWIETLVDKKVQASYDRHRGLLLLDLGHLAEALPNWTAERIRLVVAELLFTARSCSD